MKWNKQEKKQRILNRSLMLIVAWEWIYRAGEQKASVVCASLFLLVFIIPVPGLRRDENEIKRKEGKVRSASYALR